MKFAVSFFVLVFLMAAAIAGEKAPAIPGVEIRSITFNEALGLYEIVTQNDVIYATKDAKHVIIGNIFEVPSMRNLTEERRIEAFRVAFSDLPLKDAVKVGSGGLRVAVFSSPDCQWCRKLHEEMPKAQGVTFYVFVLPFGRKELAAQAACGGRDGFDRAYRGQSTGFSKECPVLSRNMELAVKLRIGSLPTILFEDGRRHSGYIPASEIVKMAGGKTG